MPFAFILFDSPLCNENDSLVKPLIILFISNSPPRSVLYLLSRQYIGTSIASLGIALIDSILLVFTRPNRDTTIFAYQLAFM